MPGPVYPLYGQTGPREPPLSRATGLATPTLVDRDLLGRLVQGQIGAEDDEVLLIKNFVDGKTALQVDWIATTNKLSPIFQPAFLSVPKVRQLVHCCIFTILKVSTSGLRSLLNLLYRLCSECELAGMHAGVCVCVCYRRNCVLHRIGCLVSWNGQMFV